MYEQQTTSALTPLETVELKDCGPQDVPVSSVPSFNILDPACHSQRKLVSQDITMIMQAGPSQPTVDFSYPKVGARCFQAEWFYKTLPNDNMRQRRNWLSYSVSKNSAYFYRAYFLVDRQHPVHGPIQGGMTGVMVHVTLIATKCQRIIDPVR